jgi:hypothetical protein
MPPFGKLSPKSPDLFRMLLTFGKLSGSAFREPVRAGRASEQY